MPVLEVRTTGWYEGQDQRDGCHGGLRLRERCLRWNGTECDAVCVPAVRVTTEGNAASVVIERGWTRCSVSAVRVMTEGNAVSVVMVRGLTECVCLPYAARRNGTLPPL